MTPFFWPEICAAARHLDRAPVTGLTLHIPTLETERMFLRALRAEDIDDEAAFFASERSRFVDGAYAEPELLGPEVNCGSNRFNVFVAPDESFAIVPDVGHYGRGTMTSPSGLKFLFTPIR